MPKVIGDVAIVINPDTAGFRQLADAKIKRDLAGFRPKVVLGADSKEVNAAITGLKARMAALSKTLTDMRIGADTKEAEAKISRLQVRLAEFIKTARTVTMEADTRKLDAAIAREQAKLAGLRQQMSRLQMDADAKKARAKITGLEKEAHHLQENLADMTANVDIKHAEARLKAIDAELRVLKSDARKVQLDADNKALKAAIAVSSAEIARLRREAADIRLGANIDTGRLDAQMLELEASAEKLAVAMKKDTTQTQAFQGIVTGNWWRTAVLGIGIWHIALDAALETVIALIGAGISLGAGLAAMSESAYDVGVRLESVRTVSAALGSDIPPLTGKFDALMTAMAPRTIEAFGGALFIVRSQTGNLLHEMEPVVNLLDTWVAKIDLWVGHQHQFGAAVSGGMVFLRQFGQIFGNLGQAISNLLSKDPGIAQMLGSLIVLGTQAVNAFSKLPGPLVTTALALHGVYLWGKVLLAAPILGFARSVGILSEKQLAAAKSALNWKAALGFLATNPFGWAVDAAIAIGFLVYQLHQMSDVAKSSIGTMEQELAQLSGGDAILAISADIGHLREQIDGAFGPENIHRIEATYSGFSGRFKSNTVSMAQAGSDLAHGFADLTSGKLSKALGEYGNFFRQVFDTKHAAAMHQAGQDVQAYRGEIVKLTADQGNLFATTGGLVRQGFSVAQSFSLMTLAGVKYNDTAAIMWQKVQNLIAGYQNLAGTGGALENSVNAVTFATLQQQEKVGELNKAWDTFFQTVTGGESGFLSFASQTIGLFRVLGSSAIKMGESNGKVSLSMSGLAKASQGAAVSMTGLNDVSINARETFLRSAEAANTQLDSLTLLANAAGMGQKGTNLLAQATRDMVAALLPATQHSQALTDVLYVLAQRGGYQGADSFKALSEWVGKTRDPMQNLDKITTTLTTHAANLTQDVQNLSIALGQTLNDAMAAAILQATGGQKTFDALATALIKTGVNSKATQDAGLALANQLVKLTGNAKDAHDEFVTFAEKITGSKDKAEELWKEISGKLSPALNAQANKTLPGIQKAFMTFAEAGLNDTHKQAENLWSQITTKLGPGMHDLGNLASGPAKAKFIDWAENGLHLTKQKATELWKECVTLQQKIDALHGKNMKITMQANGYVKITEGKSTYNISQGAWFSPHAAGGFISGGKPGQDSVPAMLMPGEVVVPTDMVNAGAVDHLRGSLPGFRHGGRVRRFAKGGQVGSLTGDLASWPDQMYADIGDRAQADEEKAARQAMAAAVKAGIKLALQGSGQSVLRYAMSFLHKVPYVWGGSTPAGWDCSGFVSYVLDHLGLFHGRTTAAGFQSWAKASGPVPGGLAFYGTPAHHVGFVVNGNTLLSALGRKWGTTLSALNMGDNSGYGIPPKGFGMAGGVPGGGALPKGKLQELAYSLLNQYGWGRQWASFNALENSEAGWNMRAVNPSSGAYGLAQFINGPSEYFQYGGDPNTALGQLTAMMNYIAQRYPSGPNQAWAFHLANNWYGKGGRVPGMASGGAVGTLRSRLAAEQRGERAKYAGLRHAFLSGPAPFRTKMVMSELATLASRQQAEEAAYAALAGSGLTTTRLHHLGATARSELRTAGDKALSARHPLWAADLRRYLAQISSTASGTVPAGSVTAGAAAKPGAVPAGKVAKEAAAYLTAWRTRHGGGYGAAWGPVALNEQIARMQAAYGRAHTLAGASGLTRKQHAYWAGLAAAERKKLGVLTREQALERSWRGQLEASDAKISSWITAAGHLPGLAGDVREWKAQIARQKRTITAISTMLGYSSAYLKAHPDAATVKAAAAAAAAAAARKAAASIPPAVFTLGSGVTGPSLGPVSFSLGAGNTATAPIRPGEFLFDQGGVLTPGWNLAYNGTGRNEPLVPAGGGDIHVHLHNQGVIGSRAELDNWLNASIDRLARNGRLNFAFKRSFSAT